MTHPRRTLPSEEMLVPFRFESRKVSQDGFVSFDGVRYGVPWVYSNREAMVRLLRGQVEIWIDGVFIARHEQAYRLAIVRLPGQYEGLSGTGTCLSPPDGSPDSG